MLGLFVNALFASSLVAAESTIENKVHQISHLLTNAANHEDYRILDDMFDENAKCCVCGVCYDGREKFKAGLNIFFNQMSNPTVNEADTNFLINANYFQYDYTTLWSSSTTEGVEVHTSGSTWGKFNARDKVSEFNFGCSSRALNDLKVTFANIHDQSDVAQERALHFLSQRKFDKFSELFADGGVFTIPGLLHATGPADILKAINAADADYGAMRLSHFAQKVQGTALGGSASTIWTGVLKSAETGKSVDPESGEEVDVPRVLQLKAPACAALVRGSARCELDGTGNGKIASLVLLTDAAATRKAFDSCFHKHARSEL